MSKKNTIEETFKEMMAAKNQKSKEDKKDPKDEDNKKPKSDDDEDKDEKKSSDDNDDDNDDDKKNDKKGFVPFKKKDKKDMKEDTTVEESTEAAASLRPAARAISDDKAITTSKVSMMNHTMGLMNGMGKDDMVSFFDKVIGQFGPGKDYGVSDNSSKNMNTLNMKGSHAVSSKGPTSKDPMPKLNVKEDLDTIFEGTELSEQFKESASTLFEAAINARLVIEVTRLEENFEEQLNEELNEFTQNLTTKLDNYLDYVVEDWMKDNEVALESSLRNELTMEFIEGLKGLFTEHYIEIPEDKTNVLESLADKVNDLEKKLDESITENANLKSVLSESTAKSVFEELSSDLAVLQQEKFATLAEGIEFDGNVDLYSRKLNIIKERYFSKDASYSKSNINEEVYEGEELNESTKHIDANVNRYVQAINKSTKNS